MNTRRRKQAKAPIAEAYEVLTSNLQMARGFRLLYSCFSEIVREDLKKPDNTRDFLPLILSIGYKLSDLASGFTPEAGQHDTGFFQELFDTGVLDVGREPTEAEKVELGEKLAASWRSRTGREDFWWPTPQESRQVGQALRRGLLSQSLMISVSALEGYVKDVTSAAVISSDAIRRRFYDEAKRRGGADLTLKLLDYGSDAYGDFVADLIGTLSPKALDRHFQKLLATPIRIWNEPDRERFTEIMHYRNVIAHRAGIVDSDFRRLARCREPVGTSVRVSSDLARVSIEIADRVSLRIQEAIVAEVVGKPPSPDAR